MSVDLGIKVKGFLGQTLEERKPGGIKAFVNQCGREQQKTKPGLFR